MADAMIEFRDVTKRYAGLIANDRFSLSVRPGELMTLLGPSGCGKTTALRCLTGILRPEAGRILLDGADVTDLPTHQRELGMVFQNFALFPHMTVLENVAFPLMIRKMARPDRERLAREALRLVRLEGYVGHAPRQLSGGQQQRVGLARALVYRPKVLLLDEPLSNLDAKLREEMRFEIKEVVTRLGITAMYVTHDQGEALALSDRVAIMNRGRLEQLGTPEEIYESPRSRFVAEFIGLSNFLDGTVQSIDGAIMAVAAGGLRISTPALPDAAVGRKVLLFLRPNEIELLPLDGAASPQAFSAAVEKVTYLGDTMDYRLRLGDGVELRVQTEARKRYRPGEHVRVALPKVRSWLSE
jgi:ABC-type Fe3+/spermidine/putrescine transport system ATPase subunit